MAIVVLRIKCRVRYCILSPAFTSDESNPPLSSTVAECRIDSSSLVKRGDRNAVAAKISSNGECRKSPLDWANGGKVKGGKVLHADVF